MKFVFFEIDNLVQSHLFGERNKKQELPKKLKKQKGTKKSLFMKMVTPNKPNIILPLLGEKSRLK